MGNACYFGIFGFCGAGVSSFLGAFHLIDSDKVYTHGFIQDARGKMTHHMHPTGDASTMLVCEDLLTVREFADRMKVQPETVRNWRRSGRIHGTQLPGGSWRIPDYELLRLMPSRGCSWCERGVPLLDLNDGALVPPLRVAE